MNVIFDTERGVRHEEWGKIIYDKKLDKFFAEIEDSSLPKKLQAPIGAGWMVTGACNLKCIHCYGNHEEHRGEILSKQDALKVVKNIASSGIMRQTLSGGEPLLYPHAFYVVDALADHGVSVIFGTNGIILNGKTAKQLHRCNRIEISLDAASEELHNVLRRTTININPFNNALNAICKCREEGLNVRVLTCLNRYNYQYLPELANLLQKLDISEWSISWTMNVGRAGLYYDALVPSDRELTVKTIEALKQEYPSMDIRYSDRRVNFNRFFCIISPDGKIGTSDFLLSKHIFYGSLVEEPLLRFWDRPFYDIDAHFSKWIGDRVVKEKKYINA